MSAHFCTSECAAGRGCRHFANVPAEPPSAPIGPAAVSPDLSWVITVGIRDAGKYFGRHRK